MTTAIAPRALRDYQQDVVNKLRDIRATGKKKIILQCETGGGKTACAGYLISLAHSKGKRAIFLASGRELVNQADNELWEWGTPHGLIMAGAEQDPAPIYVASKQTLVKRCLRRKKFPPPTAQLVICDEAHESLAKDWQDLLTAYEQMGATIIGLTATPARMDGRGLGNFWDAIVQAVPPSKLIKDGWIVPTRTFAPYKPNLKGVKRSGGDYSRTALAKKMDKPELIGDVVTHWQRYGEGRQTLVYGCTIEHAVHLRDAFRKAGISAEHVDSTMETIKRDNIIQGFKDGRFVVLTNVAILKQGVDLPTASCGVLVRPTLSFTLYRQVVGRLKRPAPGKTDCVLLDHAGAVWRHGVPDEDVVWSLDAADNVNQRMTARAKKERKPLCCKVCHAVFQGTNKCPNCGTIWTPDKRDLNNKVGILVPVSTFVEQLHEEDKDRFRERYWHRCMAVAYHRGSTVSMAAAMYYGKFTEWPKPTFKNVPPQEMWRFIKVAQEYPQYHKRKGV